MSERIVQVSHLIKEAAADFLNKESNRVALMTITRADISSDLRNATVYFTVLPDTYEDEALNFARRKRAEFKDYLKSHLRLKRIPFIEFEIDKGEKHRQRIDDVTRDTE